MLKNRIVTVAAVGAIAFGAFAGGTAQANAVSIPTSIGATSFVDVTPKSGPWSWLCSKIGQYIGPQGCR